MKLAEQWQHSSWYTLFNLKDDLAKGRLSLMLHNALGSMITWMTTGLFHTSFLMANDIDLVNINIITFVPYIAGCFALVGPVILERFQKRKHILISGRFLSFTFRLLCTTILPLLVKNLHLKIICFVALEFLSSVIDNVITSGLSAWHIRFMPENIRADFLAVSTLVTQTLGIGAALLSSVVADALNGSPYEQTIIVILRYAAYGLAILNCLVLAWPKELPYETTRQKPRLTDIFTIPCRNRKFILTMGIVFLWGFFASAPGATLNYYLLNNVGVSYSFINIINMFYALFLILFTPFWKKRLRDIGWWKTFAYAAILHVPTTIMYSCVTSFNFLWLLPTLRLIQHFLGVGMNIAYENVAYLNMPYTDQTNYMSFRTLINNASAFAGMMASTWFVATFPDICLSLLGLEFINAQILLWVQALGQLVIPLLILRFLPAIQPDDPRRRNA